MMKLLDIPKDESVKRTIKHFCKGDYKAVMLIGINQDDTTFLQTSNCDGYQKTYMAMFAQSYIVKLLNEGQDD